MKTYSLHDSLGTEEPSDNRPARVSDRIQTGHRLTVARSIRSDWSPGDSDWSPGEGLTRDDICVRPSE